jgi:hypothetical protein
MDDGQQPQKNASGADSADEKSYVAASPRTGFLLHVNLGPFAAPESMQIRQQKCSRVILLKN